MRPLRFDIKVNEGLNEYHLGATYDKWLEKTIWTGKKEFYNTLCDNFENQKSHWHELFYNLAYHNCTHEENIFIYERLIWDLIQNRNVYVIINFRAALFLSDNDLSFDKVNWEYEIEYQSNLENTETIFSDNGFVQAKTSWIKPPTPRWDNKDESRTAIFKIDSFEIFIKVIFSCIMDDRSSLNFFCIDKSKKGKLIETLQSTDKPVLHDILEKEDLFVTLLLGADEGYQDYILIKSKTDLSDKVNDITLELSEGGEIYEAELESVSSYEQLTRLIEKSFGLKVDYR